MRWAGLAVGGLSDGTWGQARSVLVVWLGWVGSDWIGSAQVRSGPVRSGPVWSGPVRSDRVQSGSHAVRLGWLTVVRSGQVRLGQVVSNQAGSS